ncbi:cytochrome bo3 quinol oxidase subunit 2 [Raoultella sp. BIGb0138]|uniref:ubiquinol oxidase subunit II n=1 Tax=Raoultella sp. BIGb0138 TaxID=2485115 RepID=UPI0010468FCE|nr:ubiquinol oxidase subunit II [Raoultella sp. BIGb0138]TCW17655.1 cytochrome bo3 quinol oxidase subunit 2 [Raoultella sp. BIGb0138]
MLKRVCQSLRLPLALGILPLLSGCNWALFNSKGAVGIEQRNLIITAIMLMLIVVIPAIVMTFLFAWRYRTGNRHARYTPEWAHSNKVEIIVWGVPLCIIVVLAIVVWVSTHRLDPYRPLESSQPPLTVEVVATDWKWVFIYPEQGIATVNDLVLPVNRPVSFQITSDATMNTFFIPQLGGQIYAMAGMRTQLNLIANETGDYAGMSGNFSGPGFSDMKFVAHATSAAQFDAWVRQVKEGNHPLDFNGFKQLALPSEKHPPEYFSAVEHGLFQRVIDQFMDSGMDMGSHMHDMSSDNSTSSRE